MSIDNEIIARLGEERLFVLKPRAEGESIVRPLLLSKGLKRVIYDGPWSDQSDETRFAAILRTDLERFITGGPIRVSLLGHGRPTEDMKRLGGTKEVWAIKSERRNESGIRVFGFELLDGLVDAQDLLVLHPDRDVDCVDVDPL